MKWAIELKKDDIEYCPWKAIKGQALADFLVETPSTEEKPATTNYSLTTEEDLPNAWKVYVDRSSTKG